MSIEVLRLNFVNQQVNEMGWVPEVAVQIARALTPFDDKPVPRRKLENQIRPRARILTMELTALKGDQIRSIYASLVAARDYVDIASDFGDRYFIDLWTRLRINLEIMSRLELYTASWAGGKRAATFVVKEGKVIVFHHQEPEQWDDEYIQAAVSQLQRYKGFEISFPDSEKRLMEFWAGFIDSDGNSLADRKIKFFEWKPDIYQSDESDYEVFKRPTEDGS